MLHPGYACYARLAPAGTTDYFGEILPPETNVAIGSFLPDFLRWSSDSLARNILRCTCSGSLLHGVFTNSLFEFFSFILRMVSASFTGLRAIECP